MARPPLAALIFSLLLSATAGEIPNTTETLISKNSDANNLSGKEVSSGESDPKSEVSKEKAEIGEDCGAENRCEDEKNNFVACLRVPGDESTSLSLLIINKGSEPLTLDVHGIELVELEKNAIVLQGNERKKVPFNVGPTAVNTSINLTSGGVGNCRLTFPLNDSKVNREGRFLYPASFVYLALAGLALFIAASLANKVRRARRKPGGALPVSASDGGAAGWDVDWGSEDEETPRSPTKAVSSPSVKRLAPRRFGKLEHTA